MNRIIETIITFIIGFLVAIFVILAMFIFTPDEAYAKSFTIYDASKHVVTTNSKAIDIVYESRFESFLNGEYEYKGDIVTIDNEFGNRFKPETVIPKTKKLIEASTGRVGLYATLPQNIYGWEYAKKYGLKNYKRLNDQYKELIPYLHHFSPVLYNYGSDYFIGNWSTSARWLVKESRRLDKSKKIIPYISPDVCLDKSCNVIKQLKKGELLFRINYLKRLGCDGVVIWSKSHTVLEDGKEPRTITLNYFR